MSFSILVESDQNKQLPIDLDYMTNRYAILSKEIVFPSPSFWTIEKNLFYLLRNSTKKVFESKYLMRPDYLSFDEYGTVVLAPLLMYINGVFSIEDFDLNEVVIPDFSYIIEISSDKFRAKDQLPSELETIDW